MHPHIHSATARGTTIGTSKRASACRSARGPCVETPLRGRLTHKLKHALKKHTHVQSKKMTHTHTGTRHAHTTHTQLTQEDTTHHTQDDPGGASDGLMKTIGPARRRSTHTRNARECACARRCRYQNRNTMTATVGAAVRWSDDARTDAQTLPHIQKHNTTFTQTPQPTRYFHFQDDIRCDNARQVTPTSA